MNAKLFSRTFWACLLGSLLVAGCSTIPDRETVSPVGFISMRQPGPRATMEQINMVKLRMDKPAVERLGPGDVLGIYIANITGKDSGEIPIHNMDPESQEAPAQGYPYPVRSDGTLSLPLLKEPIYVEGMSIIEAEDAIRTAYTVNKKYLEAGASISVSMIRKRTYHVCVIREDVETGNSNRGSNNNRGTMESYFGGMDRGSATSLELPAYKNDILEALSKTGGLPGLNAKNELIILRKGSGDHFGENGDYLSNNPAAFARSVTDHYNQTGEISDLGSDLGVVRIPLRVSPNETPPQLTSEDVTLLDGDVIYIQARDAEVYYTGGMIKGGAFSIPRDYDLDVLGGIAKAGGGIGVSVGGGDTSQSGGRNFLLPPSRILVLRDQGGKQVAIKIRKKDALRDPQHRILIEPNDVILLEYTNAELMFNLIFSTINIRIDPNDYF